MIEWLTTIDAAVHRFEQLRAVAHDAQEFAYRNKQMSGWCAACRRQMTFRLLEQPGGGWTNLRECLLCECGVNSRMRMIFWALDERPPDERFLLLERVTPLFAKVQERYSFAEGCEFFGADALPGETRRFGGIDVRHENLLALSYPDRSLRFVFHGDVLEHVPDMQKALSECHRVLDVGGTLLFTCPMTNFRTHIVRARVVDGAIEHLLPAGYHGNPMDQNGALVFTEPGLQLLDDLRTAGFESVELGLAFDPGQGILRDGNPYDDYNMWPVIFRATRLG